jgi:hypothetical protein
MSVRLAAAAARESTRYPENAKTTEKPALLVTAIERASEPSARGDGKPQSPLPSRLTWVDEGSRKAFAVPKKN